MKNHSPSNLNLKPKKLFGLNLRQSRKYNIDTQPDGLSISMVAAQVSPLHQMNQDSHVPSPFNPSSGVQTPVGAALDSQVASQ
mmetsp:Transcript_23748/g.36430  ORF Transcript_23748/g.36430 Transcript_23748/m.36430 type:complete len:83 (-) Transcript_23748:462-710(-)